MTNAPWKKFRRDNRAAMGIGTLIIFIAVVLVAAVAAGVLIQTSGFLQQKAASTGRVSTEQVASGIMVTKVSGYVQQAHGNVTKMAIYIEPNAGSSDIDLSKTVVSLNDGNKKVTFTYNNSAYDDVSTGYSNIFATTNAWNVNGVRFGIIVLQDEDNSLTSTNPTMNKGDKIVLAIDTSDAFGGIEERKKVDGEVRPEFGAPGIIEFTTPSSYTTNVVSLQ